MTYGIVVDRFVVDRFVVDMIITVGLMIRRQRWRITGTHWSFFTRTNEVKFSLTAVASDVGRKGIHAHAHGMSIVDLARRVMANPNFALISRTTTIVVLDDRGVGRLFARGRWRISHDVTVDEVNQRSRRG